MLLEIKSKAKIMALVSLISLFFIGAAPAYLTGIEKVFHLLDIRITEPEVLNANYTKEAEANNPFLHSITAPRDDDPNAPTEYGSGSLLPVDSLNKVLIVNNISKEYVSVYVEHSSNTESQYASKTKTRRVESNYTVDSINTISGTASNFSRVQAADNDFRLYLADKPENRTFLRSNLKPTSSPAKNIAPILTINDYTTGSPQTDYTMHRAPLIGFEIDGGSGSQLIYVVAKAASAENLVSSEPSVGNPQASAAPATASQTAPPLDQSKIISTP